MATVETKIFKHHKKADGTYNIKVRVTHKREKKYLDTPHFVSDRQLTAKLAIKDVFLKKILNDLLDDYRTTISELGEKLELFTAETLRDFLKTKNEAIDFIKFSEGHIKGLKENGRVGSAKTLQTLELSLIDFSQGKVISPNEIDELFLKRWDKYLRTPRKISRIDQFGRTLTRTVKALGDAGVHNRMRDLRILFKAAMKYYNKPKIDYLPIPHDPFENFKIVNPPETKKRNLSVEHLRMLVNYQAEGLRIICKHLKIKRFTFYWARHTFGSIARNKAGMLLEDIAMALNHINDEHKVTDIYIEKDWSLIDKVQLGVLRYLEKNVFNYKDANETPRSQLVAVRNIFEFVKLEKLAG